VIDDSIAFLGGLDMCFGRYDTSLPASAPRRALPVSPRWDTPQHALVDDSEKVDEHIWLGVAFTLLVWHDQ